jgi:hypothetical protein
MAAQDPAALGQARELAQGRAQGRARAQELAQEQGLAPAPAHRIQRARPRMSRFRRLRIPRG